MTFQSHEHDLNKKNISVFNLCIENCLFKQRALVTWKVSFAYNNAIHRILQNTLIQQDDLVHMVNNFFPSSIIFLSNRMLLLGLFSLPFISLPT